MKIQRTKNAARNVMYGALLKILNIIVPFLMRSVMLHYLGVEYLGLNGLFRSILSFLNLAELGVGSAMVFSMYKPIAEDDTDTICALMHLYRTLYRIIGLVIAVVGLALTPFLPTLVHKQVPQDMNLYILYFMNLGATVLSYWLFAYKNCLLYAHQRNDVSSRIMLAMRVMEYTLKLLALIVFRNYYLYLASQLLFQISVNILTSLRVSKIFPHYVPRGKLPKEKTLDIMHRVRFLFTSKFSNVISDSADTLVISSFLGLASLAIYQNYFFIVTSVKSLLDVVVNACVAGVGNSIITESPEKNYTDLRKITMLYGWMMSICCSMMLCLYQPFMTIWMGEENLLAFSFALCFTVYFYFICMNKMMSMFKDAAGIWKRDRFRPLTAALVNLALNLLTVRWIGLYGVLLSTVVSIVFVAIPWLLHNLFTEVYPRELLRQYAGEFFCFTAVVVLCAGASWFVCSRFHFGVWPSFFLNGCVSFLLPNAIFLLIYGRNPLFLANVRQIKGVFMRKLHK